MALFMATIKFSPASIKGLVDNPQDRRPAARAALQAVGCTLKEYYFAFGSADVVVIYEASNAVNAVAVSMALGATGTAASVQTSQLFTMDEAILAMTKAAQFRGSETPPAA